MITNTKQFNGKIKCQIIVHRHIGKNWENYFDGFEISYNYENTVITGVVEDQAALHGFIALIRNLNLKIKSVDCNECTEENKINRTTSNENQNQSYVSRSRTNAFHLPGE